MHYGSGKLDTIKGATRMLRKFHTPITAWLSYRRIWFKRNHLGEVWANVRDTHVEESLKSVNDPFRLPLVDKIVQFSPKSVLEIGCSMGMNFYLLNKRLPGIRMEGFDINCDIVKAGNQWLAGENILNARLSVGVAEEQLRRYEEQSFDVVFTQAVLIYVTPQNITEILRHMLRIAKKSVVIAEFHEPDMRLGKFINGYWVRDYVSILADYLPREQVKVTRIGKDIRPNGGLWLKYGAFIEVTKCQK